MEANKEILDRFGKEVVHNIYDDGLKYFKQLSTGTAKWGTGSEYTSVLNKLSNEDKKTLQKYIAETLSTSIFGFLKIFEECDEYKLYYEKDGQRVNLTEISEMLKAEPIIEDGWIKRFSKESDT
ncbi:MAG TPA: hypothetical protein VIM75_04810 [Ohtaekwangia sp.]|uniref:hypothetical protein n=1 Tax=Ohtaekwangia sp. TaxID=2066019 RepID=UPI002F94BDD3